MSEWPQKTLGDLIRVKHGWAFKGEFFSETGNKLVLKPGNFPIGGGIRLRPGKDDFYSGSYPPEFELSPGDLLVVMTDLTQAAPILGSPAFVPDEPVMLHNQRLGLVQIKPDAQVDQRFLYYSMLSDTSRSQIRATATGATVRHTAPERIYRVSLRVPELRVQRAIGEVLGSIDELIANNRRRVTVLEEMARAIYREWMVKFRYPGCGDVPLENSALGPIPEGWTWVKVDDLVRVVKDTVDPALVEPDTPAVGLEHIPRRQLTLDGWGAAREQGSRKGVFAKDDVLFGKIRPYFHKVCVAPTAGICSTDAIIIRPTAEHWGEVVCAISSDEFVSHATQTSNGTKMPRADWKVVGQWPIALPPVAIAEELTRIIRGHLHLAETLMFENQSLASLRDALLPKLITGQVDVSTLDIGRLLQRAVA